ncbi:MAG TPA: hypothetical protein VFZ34_12260 [Blastocatellia bacterium]|nr:hypothetical protein [Blastocatellia bacterium]
MRRVLFCLLGTCVLHLVASAHVLDQYLQVAQIALAPDDVRVELRLIPGVEVAERICTLIDADGDGQIATAEEQAYALRVLRDLELAVNGVNTPLTLSDLQFPTQKEMREGLGTIRLTFAATTKLSPAAQQQIYFRNNHLPELSVYLVNALVPVSNEIKIRGQARDPLQSEMRLSFDITAADTRAPLRWQGVLIFCLCLLLLLPQWKYLRRYLRRGNEAQAEAKKSFAEG